MVSKSSLEDLESKYAFMGERLLGTVRSPEEGIWHWEDDGTFYWYFSCNNDATVRELRSLKRNEDGGASVTETEFNSKGILRLFRLTLSEAEFNSPNMDAYLESLAAAEKNLGIGPRPTPDDEKALWRALALPLIDYPL